MDQLIKKIIYYFPERKKNALLAQLLALIIFLCTASTKNNNHVFTSKVCFQTFSAKRKENEMHRKYTLLGVAFRRISYNFTDIT